MKKILDKATKIANTELTGKATWTCQIKFELVGEIGKFNLAAIRDMRVI